MSKTIEAPQKSEIQRGPRFSVDTLAVFLALGLSLLIWAGVIKHVPW